MSDAPRLLKATDVAARLQVSRTHAYRLLERGDVATVRFGTNVRVTEEALADFIASQTVPAKPSRQRRLRAARGGDAETT